MHRIITYSVLVGFTIGMISCNLLSVEESLADYPTIYSSIGFSDLEEMNEEYQSANNNHICSTLNRYGFTGYSELFFENGVSPCLTREVVRVEMNNTDTLVTTAKKSLLKNSSYTGVQDTALLTAAEVLPLYGCTICDGPDVNNVPIEWKVTFANQKVDSVEVLETEIVVFIDALGVNRIWGNWYPDFEVPGFVIYGYEEVQNNLVGWQIDMRPYTGEEIIYTVKEQDLTITPERRYLPIENEGKQQLEIRVCWAIPINYENDNFEGWTAYVDIQEGFLIKLEAR